jgi:lipopolysaccharide transport system permease protein
LENLSSQTTVYRPPAGWVSLNFRELWRYRELLYFLAWRDLKVRYKQTFFGAAWAIAQPFVTMVVFSIFFGNFADIPSGDVPYPIFSYVALLPWNLFNGIISQNSTSLTANRQLLTKVYFPRLIIPLSTMLLYLVDFGIAFLVLLGLMLYYQISLTSAIFALPFFILLAVLTSLGVSLWLAALHVRYRDIRFLTDFMLRMWLFITPITYASSLVPEDLRPLYNLNPLVAVVEGFRWALLGQDQFLTPWMILSILVSLVLLISGLYYFRRMEQTFADMV